MGFELNNKIGPGRKPGSLNKNTISIKENFQKLIENNLEQLDNDLKALNPRERIKAIIEMTKFIVPTLKQVEADVTNKTDLTWLDNFSEEQLEKLLNN